MNWVGEKWIEKAENRLIIKKMNIKYFDFDFNVSIYVTWDVFFFNGITNCFKEKFALCQSERRLFCIPLDDV